MSGPRKQQHSVHGALFIWGASTKRYLSWRVPSETSTGCVEIQNAPGCWKSTYPKHGLRVVPNHEASASFCGPWRRGSSWQTCNPLQICKPVNQLRWSGQGESYKASKPKSPPQLRPPPLNLTGPLDLSVVVADEVRLGPDRRHDVRDVGLGECVAELVLLEPQQFGPARDPVERRLGRRPDPRRSGRGGERALLVPTGPPEARASAGPQRSRRRRRLREPPPEHRKDLQALEGSREVLKVSDCLHVRRAGLPAACRCRR
jgi:hypothetical protein